MRKLIARLWGAGLRGIAAWRRRVSGDTGMATAEYAIATLAAVAFAGVLLKVVTSSGVLRTLTGVIEGALK